MGGVDWISVVVGGVFTAALTLGGQVIIIRYQQSLAQTSAQQMTLWTTRNERATEITTLAGQVSKAIKSNNPSHYFEQAKVYLRELDVLIGKVTDYEYLRFTLSDYQGTAQGLAYNISNCSGGGCGEVVG